MDKDDVKLDWFNDFDDYLENFDCKDLCRDAKISTACAHRSFFTSNKSHPAFLSSVAAKL